MTSDTAIPAPTSLKVLIIEDETLVGLGLRAQLHRLGHQVVGQAANVAEARQLFHDNPVDLALVDIRLEEEDGLALAASLLAERRCPMIVLSAHSDPELIHRAADAGFFGYLVKPCTEAQLAAQIELAVRRFADAERCRGERDRLAQELETRRLLDRAKAVLIKRAGLSEDEAHRRLQQESQKKRIPLAELCRRLLEAEELLG